MIARPIIEIANLLGVAVLARLVAPADFGRYAIALIVLLLATVPTWAVGYAIVQRDQIDRDHLRTGQTLTILMGLAVCAFCFAASYTVVPVLFGERTALLVRLMIPACFINSVNTVQYSLLTRRLEFRRLSLLDMTITLGGSGYSIPLAVAGLNGEAMVLGVVAASTAGYILLCCWVRPPVPNFHLQLGARPPAVRDSRCVWRREHGGFPKLRLRDRRRALRRPSGWLLLPRVHARCRVSEEGEPR